MSYERHMLSEFPEIAKFFKPDLNDGKQPKEIPYKSNTVYTWQCERQLPGIEIPGLWKESQHDLKIISTA